MAINRFWPPGLDVTEPATPRTRVTQDHDRRRAPVPTLTHIWATGLLADGVQFVFFKQVLEPEIALAARHLCSQPIGLLPDPDYLRAGAVVQHHTGQRKAL